MSHLLQMRGLKPTCKKKGQGKDKRSHLLQMRGLKPTVLQSKLQQMSSHLLQMRGLKLKRKSVQSIVSCRIFYRCVD